MSRSCEWVRARIARFHDGDLPPDERAEVEEHLASCPACSSKLAAFRKLDALVTDIMGGEEATDAGETTDFLARFHERHDLEAADRLRREEMQADFRAGGKRTMSPEEIAAAPLDKSLRRRPARSWSVLVPRAVGWRWATLGGAAAAAIIIVAVLVREPDLPRQAIEMSARRDTPERLSAEGTAEPAAPTPSIPAPASAQPDLTPLATPQTELRAPAVVQRELPGSAAPQPAAGEPPPEDALTVPSEDESRGDTDAFDNMEAAPSDEAATPAPRAPGEPRRGGRGEETHFVVPKSVSLPDLAVQSEAGVSGAAYVTQDEEAPPRGERCLDLADAWFAIWAGETRVTEWEPDSEQLSVQDLLQHADSTSQETARSVAARRSLAAYECVLVNSQGVAPGGLERAVERVLILQEFLGESR